MTPTRLIVRVLSCVGALFSMDCSGSSFTDCAATNSCSGGGAGTNSGGADAGIGGTSGTAGSSSANSSGAGGLGGAPGSGGSGGAGGAGAASWSLDWTIDKQGTTIGTDKVQLDVNGQTQECGSTCSGSMAFGDGEQVTLTVPSVGRSGYWFTGWEGACSGQVPTCTVTMDQVKSVTARFTAVNFAFVSSETFQTNLGGVPAYDGQCNRLATEAGINNSTSNAYIAVMSDSARDPVTRLTTARGWVRTDGSPFMDNVGAFTTNVMNALYLDENGNDVGQQTPMVSGCSGFSSTIGSVAFGHTKLGPTLWVSFYSDTQCGVARHIYCMSTLSTVTLSVPRAPGSKSIYLSKARTSDLLAAGQTPDQGCEALKPPGAAEVRALVAHVGTPASAVLKPATQYVRPDGVLVGTGTELIAKTIKSAIWQTGDGQYVGEGSPQALTMPGAYAYTGAPDLTTPGTIQTTCNDFTDYTGTMIASGAWNYGDASWWESSGTLNNCYSSGLAENHPVYCVEQ